MSYKQKNNITIRKWLNPAKSENNHSSIIFEMYQDRYYGGSDKIYDSIGGNLILTDCTRSVQFELGYGTAKDKRLVLQKIRIIKEVLEKAEEWIKKYGDV